MLRIITLHVIILPMVLLACNSDNFNLSEVRKSILTQNTKRITAMKNGDIDTLMELYAEDATLLPPFDTIKRGKDQINMFYILTPQPGIITDASIVSIEISGRDPTLFEIGEYEITRKLFDSDATHTDHGKYLAIWKHQTDGTWKLYSECWNSDAASVEQFSESQNNLN